MILKRVVVTGIGAITPIGNDVPSFWKGLEEGISGAEKITKFDTTHFKTKFACEVKDFDVSHILDKKEIRRFDLFSQYAMAASEEAILDANILDPSIDRNKIGVIWSSGIGGVETFQNEVIKYAENGRVPKFSPFFVPRMIVDIASGHISMRHGFKGMNFCVVSACASSTNAMIDAFNYLRLGRANIIVCGGSEASVNEVSIGGFNALRALSERNDGPKSASRPYDSERDGFVMGEGGGCLILETLEHAQERGAKIYAELIGGGMSADAYHLTAPHPDGEGAQAVMLDALRDAEIQYSDIDYINTHGTSTPLGDLAEVNAIQKVFGDHAYQLNISSTKSMTGHLLGAAGIIEAIACIGAIKNNVIPPTINHFEIDANLDAKLNFTFNKAQKKEVNYALSNTFGFGGHNASVIFKKYSE
ncbi:MAG TPA: beta-ketoacyl-ACP synthase II [Chitinophagales bacterium]|nr:beta-ketoacyl-ACP synthase II [Chitinophagales bacterium]